MGLNDILGEAKKMQKMMEVIQQELQQAELTVTAGGGAVTVVVSGMNEVKSVKINPDFLKEDAELVEKTITEAIQEALQKSKKLHEEKIGKLTSSFKLPGLM